MIQRIKRRWAIASLAFVLSLWATWALTQESDNGRAWLIDTTTGQFHASATDYSVLSPGGSSPTFADVTISNMTPGSVLFAGTGGLVSQDNANLFWNNSSNRLGILTASPGAPLHGALDGGTVPSISANTGLVVSNNSAAGDDAFLSIIAGYGSIGESRLNFGDTSSETGAGQINYRHDIDRMGFRVGNNEVMRIATGAEIDQISMQPGEVVINDGSADIDFRVESDNSANALFVQGSNGNIGILKAAPTQALDVVGNIQLTGEMMGQRSVFMAGLATTSDTSEARFTIGGAVISATRPGFAMMRPGSIVGISFAGEVTAVPLSGTILITAYKNSSAVFSVTSATISATGDVTVQGTQARGTDTFVAGDALQLQMNFLTMDGTIIHCTIAVEVVFDT